MKKEEAEKVVSALSELVKGIVSDAIALECSDPDDTWMGGTDVYGMEQELVEALTTE